MVGKRHALLAFMMLPMVALAGCAEEAEPEAEEAVAVDTESFQLEAGKGAVAGLLVDDRFRPIHLTDDPQTEFQAEGFVLLQETGEQVRTTENGEFSFVDLEPGQYTLRVTVEGHEATPQRIQVTEGLFNEISVIARRVTTEANAILTEEFSVFIPCAFVVPGVGLFTLNCVLDLSGDSFRSSVTKDYSAYDGMTYLVAELKAQNPSNYAFPLRDNGLGCPCYGRTNIVDDDWGKVILSTDPDAAYDGSSEPWTIDKQLNIGMFFSGDVPLPPNPVTGPYVGVKTGIQADFLVSMFMGPPEIDVEGYCVICE